MAIPTKDLLAARGLAASKKRGQNFLKHRSTAQQIVARANFSSADHVIEVGVGLGALTLCLAAQVKQVTGIEIDRGIVAYLEESGVLPDNVSLIHEDVLKCDFAVLRKQVEAPLKIISNLPYSISNPFIFKLIDHRSLLDRVVILLQKEMALRLCAVPRTKEYGIPSILLQSCAEVRHLLRVGAAEFHPRPKVDSLLIEIRFAQPEITDEHFKSLRTLVRAAFSARRKTLANNLSGSLPADFFPGADKARKRALVLEKLEEAGLSPAMRAEEVAVDGFKRLAEKFSAPT